MTANDNDFWMHTFEEHGSSVLAFLTSRLGRRDLAEDLLQETFVRAMRRGSQLSEGGNIRAYLLTTAYHLIVNQSRKKRPASFSEIAADDNAWVDRLADPQQTSPEQSTELSVFGDHLAAALATLKPDHRQAFEAAVMRQLTYTEVAEQQGCSLEKVKSDVYRARKQVMEQLRMVLRPSTEIPS